MVALSSIKAENVTLGEATKGLVSETVWWKQIRNTN